MASSVTGLSLSEVIGASAKFILVAIGGLLVISYCPPLSTFLAGWVYGS